jgi:hypothetical protein
MEKRPIDKAKELVDNCYLEMSDFNVSEEVLDATAKRLALNSINEMYTLASYLDNVQMMNYCTDVEQEINKL